MAHEHESEVSADLERADAEPVEDNPLTNYPPLPKYEEFKSIMDSIQSFQPETSKQP